MISRKNQKNERNDDDDDDVNGRRTKMEYENNDDDQPPGKGKRRAENPELWLVVLFAKARVIGQNYFVVANRKET